MIPLALIHTAYPALVLAVPIGIMGGIATAAYFDLAMRACPPGLHGTLMMLVDGVYYLAQRGGWIPLLVVATAVVYALILPLILLVPKELIATADGESNPVIEAEVPDAIAGG
jgi:hypothetical protein